MSTYQIQLLPTTTERSMELRMMWGPKKISFNEHLRQDAQEYAAWDITKDELYFPRKVRQNLLLHAQSAKAWNETISNEVLHAWYSVTVKGIEEHVEWEFSMEGLQSWALDEDLRINREKIEKHQQEEQKKMDAVRKAFDENPNEYWMLAMWIHPLDKAEAEKIIQTYENALITAAFPGGSEWCLSKHHEAVELFV